jgi:hypothetical protein
MQDAEVASMRLAEMATGDTALPPATVFVMGAVAERHRREVNRYLRRLPKHASRVGGRAWRDLEDLMEDTRAEAEAALPPVRRTLRAVPSPAPGAAPTEAATAPADLEHGGHPAAGGVLGGPSGPQAVRPSGQRE